MRKQFVLIVALLCVALSGYAQMVVKGKAGGVLYEVNIATQTATVLGTEGSPTELTIPMNVPQFEVTEFAMNPTAVGTMMSFSATVSTIANGAFVACSSLTSVTMEVSTPPILSGTFLSTFPLGVIIYVPNNSAVTAYQEAGWLNVQTINGDNVSDPTGNCGAQGDNLTWTYSDGTLYINGSGAMADFTIDYTVLPYAANTPWKQYLYSITNIEFPEGITYIGQGAFFGMDKVKKVVFPEGLIEIGDNAFGNCQGIKSFTFPSTLQTVGNGMFSNNYAIREIISDATVPADMKENKLNQGASKIDVYVPEGSIEAYEAAWGTTYYTFHNPKNACGTNLLWSYDADTHVLTLYKSDPSKPATMYNFVNISYSPEYFNTPDAPWYEYHDEITSISLPDGLTNIGTMAFCNCSTVVDIEIPTSVVRIDSLAFGYCHAIPSIDIPEGVQSIGTKAFVGCSALDTIAIPAGISTIKESTFEWCSGLTHIVIPATVQTIELSAFTNCANLVRIDVESEIPASIAKDINVSGFMGAISNGQRVFGREYSDGGDVDIEAYIPSGTKAAYEAAWGTETAVDVLGTHQVQCRLNYHDPAEQTPTGVESIESSAISVQKVLKNGQIFIQRGENTYSLDGKRL